MAHPRRQFIASVLLLGAIAWGVAVWIGPSGHPDETARTLGWLVWHRVGSVVLAAGLTIYLFLTAVGTRSK